jgi:hypothetical protein
MSIFGSIMGKIFNHGHTRAASPAAPAAPVAAAPHATPIQPSAPAAAPVAPAAAQSVDVGAVLAEMASMQNGGGNYKTSIVDLLSLLGLDSDLTARKELADELGVHAGAPGTAEQNIALHKAVLAKLAENGGMVPDSLRN